MNKIETQKIIAVMMASYPNFKLEDVNATVEVWKDMLIDFSYEHIDMALKCYIRTDTSGFAPTPGQLIDQVKRLTEPEELNETEAWSLVIKAISNGTYNSAEEFLKLPQEIQRGVGSAEQLRQWAMTENLNYEVAKSQFLKTYKREVDRKKELGKLPSNIKRLIDSVNIGSERLKFENNNLKAITATLEDKKAENEDCRHLRIKTEMSEKNKIALEELKNSVGR